MNFNDLGLTAPILRAIAFEKYTQPTPIQIAVIPKFLNNSDIIGIAQTGTGKTAAFVLPVLERLVKKNKKNLEKTFPVLILVPTRELAMQIVDKIKIYGKIIRPKTVLVVGGAKPGPQIKLLKGGADIVVATPGRLLDHVKSKVALLSKTNTIILDEADQMLDLGFMPSIKSIISHLPKDKQAILLSATMPKSVRTLADSFLKNPEEINVAPVAKPIELIDQRVFLVKREAKIKFIQDIFDNHNIYKSIIFVRTKIGANKLAIKLNKLSIKVDAIHGDKSQSQRNRTLQNFRSGKLNILIATDIAARGIDIKDISHIINYDMPNESEIYVHRIGRTARAGKNGMAISLCDISEKKKLRSIEKLIGYSLYAKVINISDALVLDQTPKNINLKKNTKEKNINNVSKSIKKKNTAKLFSKKAKKRFAEKRKKKKQGEMQSLHHRNSNKISIDLEQKTNNTKKAISKKNKNKPSKTRFKNGKREFNLDKSFSGKI